MGTTGAWRRHLSACGGALALCLAQCLRMPVAHAAEPVAVWYRSAEGCPDGSAFLRELERRATPARLAGMGDHIDFVVTLGADATRGWGRVERQTERGTVAIRELEAPTCDAVANGLALSLVLAVDPEATPSSPAAPDPRPHGADNAAAPDSDETPATWRAGVASSMWTLVGSKPSFGAGPFVEFAPVREEGLLGFDPVFRLGGFATLPSEVTKDVSAWLAGGRAEACPWVIGFAPIELSPCVGVELGALLARRDAPSDPRDRATWAALAAHGRLAWLITSRLALEAQAGIVAPFGRHDFLAETPPRAVARSRALGFSAGLGVSVHLP